MYFAVAFTKMGKTVTSVSASRLTVFITYCIVTQHIPDKVFVKIIVCWTPV